MSLDLFSAVGQPWRSQLEGKVRVAGECWEWATKPSGDGYTHVCVNRKHYLAHRLTYMLNVGPLVRGLEIDHLCRNRRCVRPAHLECVNGHPFDAKNTYVTPDRRRCRSCHSIKNRAYRQRKLAMRKQA